MARASEKKTQKQKFIDAARQVDSADGAKRFENALRAIARPKPAADKAKKETPDK